MPSKKRGSKSTTRSNKAKRKTQQRGHHGAVGLLNRNQRRQLEQMGLLDDPPKKKR